MQPSATKRHLNFSEYLELLESEGELLRLDGNISGLKMAEKASYECKTGGKALLFERDIPIAMNLFASDHRIEKALSYGSEVFTEAVYNKIKLSDLPILKHHKGDISGSINMGCVISGRDSGIYRIQPLSDSEAIVHCYPSSTLAKKLRSGDIPVTIAIGTSPILILLSASSSGNELDKVSCDFIDSKYHQVPSGTQIIINGVVSASEKRPEGPFMIYTGDYSQVEEYPLLHIESVEIIENGIYHTLVTGKYPMESEFILKAAKSFHNNK